MYRRARPDTNDRVSTSTFSDRFFCVDLGLSVGGSSAEAQNTWLQIRPFRSGRHRCRPAGGTHYAEEKTGGHKAKKAKTSSIVIGRKDSSGVNVFACNVQSIKSNRNLQITWRVRHASKSKAMRDTRGLGGRVRRATLEGPGAEPDIGQNRHPRSSGDQDPSTRWALESLGTPTPSDVVATEASATAAQGFSKRCALAMPTEA